MSVTKFQENLRRIYGVYNDTHFTDHDLMFRLYELTMKCLESLRKERYDEVRKRLPHLVSWLCAFCNRRNIVLPETVWHKYPNICPYGLETRGCICITRELVYKPSLSALSRLRENRTDMPKTFRDFQMMFETIYGPVNRVKSIVAVLCHLAEEIGEIGKDYRIGNEEGMRDEIADTFAWICGLATRLDLNLETDVWDAYPDRCHTCRGRICECPGSFSRI